MNEFISSHMLAFSASMADSRFNNHPSMTFWVVPKGKEPEPGNRRLLLRNVFSYGESANTLVIFNSDGSVLMDSRNDGENPSININAALNKSWTGDEDGTFASLVAEFMSVISLAMLETRQACIHTNADEQEVLDKTLSTITAPSLAGGMQ